MNVHTIPDALYPIAMVIVLIGWVALIVFPWNRRVNFWFSGIIVPLALSLLYIYVLLTFWLIEPRGNLTDFLTLKGVYRMFGNNGLLLSGWIDLIAIDLFVGAWMTRKAAQVGIRYIYLLPCLILTFIFAGFGFALFSIVAATNGGWSAIGDVEKVPPTDSPTASARVRAE
jgi:ABA DEFICIENT 4-like